jgi:hypothetical protein
MGKMSVLYSIVLLAASASAEIRSIDIGIFGMD